MQHQKQITVASVFVKEGVSKSSGKPYKKYTIKDTEGIEYSTFEAKYGDMFQQGQSYGIVYNEKLNGQYLNRDLVVPKEYRTPRNQQQQQQASIDLSKTNELLEQINLSLALIADYYQNENARKQASRVAPQAQTNQAQQIDPDGAQQIDPDETFSQNEVEKLDW